MKTAAFWKSSRVLLEYKRGIAIGLIGALLSAACFGAGLSMLLPIFHLMIQQGQGLSDLVEKYLDTSQGVGQWLLGVVPEDPFQGFAIVIGVVCLLSVVGAIGRYVHVLSMGAVTMHAGMRLRRHVYRHIVQAPLAAVVSQSASDRLSRILTDIHHLQRAYLLMTGRTIEWIFRAFAALTAAAVLKFSMTIFAIVVAGVALVLFRKFGKRIKRASKAAMSGKASLLQAMSEALRGIAVVKVHNAEGYERRRVARLSRKVYDNEWASHRYKSMSSPLMELLGFTAGALAALVAAWSILRNNVEPEIFMTVLAMLGAAGASLKPLSNFNNALHDATAAAERYFELLDTPVEPRSAAEAPGAVAIARHRRSICFEHVTYSYPHAAEPALRDVSLDVQHGQTIAVVGPNGSGKSTLLNMLPRLIEPQSGRVLIDDVDIAGVTLRSLRSQIAVVTQHTILFEGTIAENIAYGRRHIHMDRVLEAARAAYVDEFVRDLPEQYEAMLGEDGVGLSGGQRQRLCIARAILRDPAILILDEATSQIDTDSEAKINDALQHFQRGRTTFIIAHRLSTVVDADRIVVMNEGAIEASGSHEQLLVTSSTYRTLTQTQLQPALP